MTSLRTEAYRAQHERWPTQGRHILAQYDDDTVIVYQAYRPSIGHAAAADGRFGGGGVSFGRMSWIKPNFLWMMFRSGWGTKADQEVTLAVRLRREGFDASEDGTGRVTPIIPVAPSLTASNDPSRSPQSAEVTQQVAAVHAATMTVRRLTPRECERLQAFPDDYTMIPWRKKPADQCPDGPRYKALGNSWAVPVVRWIGKRIQERLNAP
jgi:site-specific DNA-cytosine methylase